MANTPGPAPKALKAYKNQQFLNSPDARIIRIMAEYLEPLNRFHTHGIDDTIVFFGSSRFRSSEAVKRDMERLQPHAGQAAEESRTKLAGLNHLFQTAKTGSEYEYIRIEETISPQALRIISDWILNQVRK